MAEIDSLESDLSDARNNLKENVSALSEKLTIGRVIDEMVLGGDVDWNAFGAKTTGALKAVIPGAVVGAGIALLIANRSSLL